MILLPEVPMTPRIADSRVGFSQSVSMTHGSNELKSDSKTYIRRWRLEPKDPAAYARGELVAIKPIVYYIDPATPEKLRKYIKQGVEEWQNHLKRQVSKCYYKDPPTKEEDPDFSQQRATCKFRHVSD
jgi:hypothetical protein